MNKEEIRRKKYEVSKRIGHLDYLIDNELITISKFTKSRQKLIAELHTLDFVLGYQEDVDSAEWFKKLEKGDSNAQ